MGEMTMDLEIEGDVKEVEIDWDLDSALSSECGDPCIERIKVFHQGKEIIPTPSQLNQIENKIRRSYYNS